MFEISTFRNDDAKKYGLLEAVILWHIRGFLTWAVTNNKNIFNGRHWTYNSVKAWQKQLNFCTEKQIRRALDNLKDEGILLTDNFNKHKYDKTTWYSINDDAYLSVKDDAHINQNGPIHLPKRAKAFAQTGEPIPKLSSKLSSDDELKKTSNNSLKEYESRFNTNSIELTEYLDEKGLRLLKKDVPKILESFKNKEDFRKFLNGVTSSTAYKNIKEEPLKQRHLVFIVRKEIGVIKND